MTLQERAKSQSEAFLRAHDVRINEALPYIEDAKELTPSSAQDVARRSIVLGYMIGIGYRQPSARLKAELRKWSLYPFTSAKEKEILEKSEFTQQEIVDATWQTECVQALAWGLGLAELDHFSSCDDDLGPKFPILCDPTDFIAASKLRPFEEIYFASDLLYRLHWASRDDRMSGRAIRLNEEMIAERRKAVDWMLGVERDWDEVPSDT